MMNLRIVIPDTAAMVAAGVVVLVVAASIALFAVVVALWNLDVAPAPADDHRDVASEIADMHRDMYLAMKPCPI
jgi:hypothetical protein